jgi:hypothetical protein
MERDDVGYLDKLRSRKPICAETSTNFGAIDIVEILPGE